MKFKSTDEFLTFDFNDTALKFIGITETQMTIGAEGVIIKADNSNNQRFEDMYSVYLEMTFDHFKMNRFDKQGYKYYNADGKLIDSVPDEPLDEEKQKEVLSIVKTQGASIFLLEKCPDRSGYEIIFDLTDEAGDASETYQIFFDFEHSLAGWDRFSAPVKE